MADAAAPLSPYVVYVLRSKDVFAGTCEYVGETDDLARRLSQHARGECDATRQLFRGGRFDLVAELLVRCPSRADAKREENELFLQRAEALGIDRVYGAGHARHPRSQEERRHIASTLDSIHGRCYVCHRAGHYGGAGCPKAPAAATPIPDAAAAERSPDAERAMKEAACAGHGKPLAYQGVPFDDVPHDVRSRERFEDFLRQRGASSSRHPLIWYGESCRLVNYWVAMPPEDPRVLALPPDIREVLATARRLPLEDPDAKEKGNAAVVAGARPVRRRIALAAGDGLRGAAE